MYLLKRTFTPRKHFQSFVIPDDDLIRPMVNKKLTRLLHCFTFLLTFIYRENYIVMTFI